MAINTFGTLKTAAMGWLNRADLASVLGDMVALAEAQMRTDMRLRATAAIERSTLVISSQYTPLPAGFESFLSVDSAASPFYRPECVTPAELDAMRVGYPVPQYIGGACQRYYAIVGTDIEVFPVPQEAETWNVAYYESIPTITGSDAGTNWLLAAQPGIYLYGTLKQTAPYLKEDERVATWGAEYERLCEAFKIAEDAKRFNASPIRIRARSIG